MKTLACFAAAACLGTGFAMAAAPDACPSGGDWVPWRLNATPNAETPIFSSSQNKKQAMLCNCSEDAGEVRGLVYVLTLQEGVKGGRMFGKFAPRGMPGKADPVSPYPPFPDTQPGQDVAYMQAGACATVGPGAVMLRTGDHRAAKWGVWKLVP